jgi:hypothetical protein
MSITKRDPRTIWLGGEAVQVNDIHAGEAITPGHLIERYDDSGTPKFRKHTTAGEQCNTFALDMPYLNKGVDDAYAAGDLVEAGIGAPGSTFWGLVASGQNLLAGAKLESAGDGTLRALASGTLIGTAVEAVDNSAGPATKRIKCEVA